MHAGLCEDARNINKEIRSAAKRTSRYLQAATGSANMSANALWEKPS